MQYYVIQDAYSYFEVINSATEPKNFVGVFDNVDEAQEYANDCAEEYANALEYRSNQD